MCQRRHGTRVVATEVMRECAVFAVKKEGGGIQLKMYVIDGGPKA